jgi:CheY-like chemotaxis protein
MALDGRPLRVLVVEDDDGDAMMIAEALEAVASPATVWRVTDGEQALARLRAGGAAARPDVILLDLNMPRMDGRETLTEIKRDDDLRAIPVVILTTSDDVRDILQTYRGHANAFVTKPMDFDALESVVQSIRRFYEETAVLPT